MFEDVEGPDGGVTDLRAFAEQSLSVFVAHPPVAVLAEVLLDRTTNRTWSVHITAQLARAFADLTVIDVLPDELDDAASHSVAIISAPIIDSSGAVTMSVAASIFATADSARIHTLGEQVSRTAHDIAARIARHP